MRTIQEDSMQRCQFYGHGKAWHEPSVVWRKHCNSRCRHRHTADRGAN